jgi:hypothetical protein
MRATNDWSAPVPDAVAFRRAGGRRKYNAMRRLQRDQRRHRVCQLYWQLLAGRLPGIPKEWGLATIIARLLGVSRATICRDLQALPNYLTLKPRGVWWPSMRRRPRRC